MLAGTALAGSLLAGCSSPVGVSAAPHAADPLCAEVVLALPRELAGMSRLTTSSQATVAWGDRNAPVVLRCGVEPPPPTTDPCVTADDGVVAVDWLAVEGEVGPDGSGDWTFTTYGRDPAVEVLVPAAVAATRSTSFLIDIGPAVARVEQTRSCL
ncbi:hypothetical protein N867_11730 [Actinotalea fermentans ATCC 43279 = JCM 9966 = DSM 3133]|nr:hypothetical protein N867_11730 [Actinotalea fermentans ATCC 43279 = JCM 9966 = DSM 3133]